MGKTVHYVGAGSFDWKEVEFAVDVPNDKDHSLAFGNAGTGDVYFGSFELKPGDAPPPDPTTWHKPKEILYAAHWVGVMRRPGEVTDLHELERELPGISSKIHYVDAPLLEIASREIRGRAAAGKPFRYYVPESVFEYIEQHHLYQQSEPVDRQSQI